MTLADKILSTNSASEDRLCILYRGREKTGKTHAMTTFPAPFFLFTDKNLATLKKFPDLRYIHLQTWKEFCEVLKDIQSDGLPEDVQSVCLDTLSSLFTMAKVHYESQGYKNFDLWGMLLANFVGRLNDLVDLSKVKGGTNTHRTYHVVISCHEKDIYKGEDGVLQKIGLKLQGQSADEVGPLFESVFCCDVERETLMPKGGGPVERNIRYVIHTVPPDSFRACGDGVGGGKYKRLPAKMPGDYHSLCAAWGREE